jgi:hypothetical protein
VDLVSFRLCETIHCLHPDFLPDELEARHLVDWSNYWAVSEGDEQRTRPTSETQGERELLAAIRRAKKANG